VSLTQPLLQVAVAGAPHLELNVDAAHFADEDIEAAARELSTHFSVGARRMYQFSVVPPPNVYLLASLDVLRDLAIGVAAAALYDGLRHLLRPRKAERSVFTFRFREGDRELSARIETSSEEALRQAIDKMPELADSPQDHHSYDAEDGEWHEDDEAVHPEDDDEYEPEEGPTVSTVDFSVRPEEHEGGGREEWGPREDADPERHDREDEEEDPQA
jgi:hypothetical protein